MAKDQTALTYSEAIEALHQDMNRKKAFEVLERYKKQKKIDSKEELNLLAQIKVLISDEWYLFLLQVYVDIIKKKGVYDNTIEPYILNECREKLVFLKALEQEETSSGVPFNETSNYKETFFQFIQNAKEQNILRSPSGNNENEQNLLAILYLYLMIQFDEKQDLKYPFIPLQIERSILECFSSVDNKVIDTSLYSSIPRSILKNQYAKQFHDCAYLYDNFRVENDRLFERLQKKHDEIERLNAQLQKQNAEIAQLSDNLIDCSEQLADERQKAEEYLQEKKEAEDRLLFEKSRFENQYKSQKKVLAEKYEQQVGLELEGIEDIIEFLSEKEQTAIKRRIDRIRSIIAEIGDE